jgi:hypothetical protein
MRGTTDIKNEVEQIVLETIAGFTCLKLEELRPNEPLVSGLGLLAKQVSTILDSIDRRLNLDSGPGLHPAPDPTIQDIINYYSRREMNRELAGLSDYVIGVVFTTLARKSSRTIDVRNTDVFLRRDLGFSARQKEEILQTIEHRLEGSVARELHLQPDCTIEEIICFHFVNAYKRLSRHSLRARVREFLSRWVNAARIELTGFFDFLFPQQKI